MGLVKRAKTSRRNPADLAGACSGGKFVVSNAGGKHTMRTRGPNRKSRFKEIVWTVQKCYSVSSVCV